VTDAEIRAALRGLREPPVTAGGANIVVGVGATLWRWLEPDAAPDELAPFEPIEGDGRGAPATQHDIWVWSHGTGEDVELDVARAVVQALAPVATLAAEQPCFVYLDSRDLTGFIDGNENPPVEIAHEVALVPDRAPGAGGAFVLAQKWVHDLGAFHAQSLEEQQFTIGRTKPDSVELHDKPPNAHIARVVIEEDGEELEIYRRSVPYGRVGELGLYFLAFSADPSRFTKMMARMFGTAGDGLHDHLTDFTRPVTGAFYFAPSLDDLDGILPSE
jgi:putative iron-dependent peroxidase